MNKKYVTIFLIVAGVAFAIIVALGLLTKTPSGKSGYQAIVDSWLNRNTQVATVDQQTSESNQTEGGSQQSGGSNSSNQSSNNSSSSAAGQQSTPSTSSSATSPTSSTTPTPTTKPSTSTTGSTSGGTSGGTTGGGTITGSGGGGGVVLACVAGGACTAAEVAAHSSQSNCWVIYGSKVYNITAFIPKHPKDYGPIIFTTSVCGHDVTPYLTGKSGSGGVKAHDHKAEAYTALNSYWYANLK